MAESIKRYLGWGRSRARLGWHCFTKGVAAVDALAAVAFVVAAVSAAAAAADDDDDDDGGGGGVK